jgi:hypothetical protein
VTARDLGHSDLVELGRRWLLKPSYSVHHHGERVSRAACPIIVTELVSHAIETPDVIGWAGVSVLIECKASRADFFADGGKSFRKLPENGMGVLRYYLVPDGLLSDEEIPEGWGHLTANRRPSGRGYDVRMRRESKIHQASHAAELCVLIGVLRSLQVEPGEHMTLKAYVFPAKVKRATLTMRVEA